MPIRDAEQLLVLDVRSIYQAEKLIQRALPKLAKRVQNERLKEALEHRREESQHLIQDLESAFEAMGSSRGRSRNEAVEGLIEQMNTLQEDIEDPELLDVALLASVQKLEHYCIGAWGAAAALARGLEHQEVAQCMEHALDEGKRWDDEMTELAESEINPAALQGAQENNGMDEEEDEDDDALTAQSASRGGQGMRGQGGRGQAGQGGRAQGQADQRGQASRTASSRSQGSGAERQSRASGAEAPSRGRTQAGNGGALSRQAPPPPRGGGGRTGRGARPGKQD